MKTTILVNRFPEVSETFIARHAKHLHANVLCTERNYALPENYYGPISIFAPSALGTRGQTYFPGWYRVRRALNGVLAPVRNFAWDETMQSYSQQYLDQHRPDVVLAEFAPNALAALEVCEQRGIPLVTHFHGYDASALMRSLYYRRALRPLFEYSAAVVCVSSVMRDILISAGCSESKLHMIACGTAVDEFTISGGVGQQPCRFVAVSRMTPGKAPLVSLNAFLKVHDARPEVTLDLVGTGPLMSQIRDFVAQHKLEEAVNIHGSINQTGVREILGKSSVFIQSSLTAPDGWMEGWGVAIAEALASGLPAVVSRSGGMVDLVTDSHNGFLFQEGDSEAMAQAMLRLADDPSLRIAMGLNGRRHVEQVGNAGRNLNLLEEVLRDASTRPS